MTTTTPTDIGMRRTLHVEHCMGTVFTIDVRHPGDWSTAVAEVVAELHRVDRVFSTYRPDSDISRMRRGELGIDGADPDVALVLDLCTQVGAETGGYFTALTPAGLDPTGLVKGWAIERAAGILRAHGSRNHAVNGGGDIQLAGETAPGQPWQVGIVDPTDRLRVLATVAGPAVPGADFAVATSGVAERGHHIVNPFTGAPPTGLSSVTVVGPSLTRADCYATAAFAMGPAALGWLERLPGYEGLVVHDTGEVHRTSRIVSG
jgi:thiamine biosynthesis lipoprotein